MSLGSLLQLTLGFLVAATVTGQVLRRLVSAPGATATVANANLRIAAWWVLCALAGAAMLLGSGAVAALFALFSCLAIREFCALPGERRTSGLVLYGVLAAATLLQYWFVWTGRSEIFAGLIPAGALFGLLWAGSGRAAQAVLGLTVCTYLLSFAPAVLTLDIPGYAAGNVTLLFYFLLVVEASDVLQYLWGKLLGRRHIAPRISPNKTWEGMVGGVVTATALGAVLYRATPFGPWEAAAICAAVTLAGFGGGLALSAVKRSRGIKDFGTLVAGHGGVLDRIDSLCFSAPVFFLVVRHLYAK
jgi:phosphatidate cytidylyltransferase